MTQTSQSKNTIQQLRQELQRLRREQKRLEKRLQAAFRRSGVPKARRSSRGDRLAVAVLGGDLQKVRSQIRTGNGSNLRNRAGEPALILAAARSGNEQIIAELLNAGANVDQPDRAGNTALITCARDEDFEIVRLLVEHGALLDASNRDGDTPLTNAACWGSKKVVEYLLRRGADPLLKDGAGMLPAEIARQQGHLALAQLIEQFAAKRA